MDWLFFTPHFSSILSVVEMIGFAISLFGIFFLMSKEQNKTTANLQIANIGCLIMNVGYYMVLQTNNPEVSMQAMKFEYMGNVLFYCFMVRFLIAYTGIEKKLKIFRFVPNCWYLFELIVVTMVWNDRRREEAFGVYLFEDAEKVGYARITVQSGNLYNVRYGMLAFALIALLIYIIIRRFMLRNSESGEKHNLSHLIVTLIAVIVPLIAEITELFVVEIVPIFASITILSLILSVLEGDFLSILDEGRSRLFEYTENACIIVDKAYGFLDANNYAMQHFPELKRSRKGDQVSDRLMELLQSEELCPFVEDRFYDKEVTALEEDGKIKGYCMVLRDVTERRLLMEELSEAKLRAEDANEAKSAFISNMSHEIRTPMNAIVGMTEMLLRGETDDKRKGYLLNIKNSGAALLTIINDILDFSKIESGKMEIIEDTYEPMSMLSDLGMIFLNRIGEKDIELLFDIDTNLPAKLYGDSLRIRQVIINIANNAIKFTEKGFVKLIIRVENTAENQVNMTVRVQDSGQGIRKEDLGKLFASFQQVDTRKNRNKEGTGLGLSISKQLVELMGGEIGVESEYGKGSVFFFTIPQGVVESEKAATIRTTDKINICALMKDENQIDNIRSLALAYGINFVEESSLPEKTADIDFCFLDEEAGETLREELAMGFTQERTQFCVLQNPMRDGIWDSRATTVNKPLFSLNFCQIINHDALNNFGDSEEYMNFTAKDAQILIVDDNDMNLKVARGLLQPLQMQIDTAESGKKALEMVGKKQYHLIFMDHMMPVMDGVETTKHLREMNGEYFQKVPVIALSANAVAGAKETFLVAGMNDFVAKPIEIKDICAKIKTWLPTELIVKGNMQLSDNFNDVREELPEIEGLNVLEGIKNSGSQELFISLLGDFYKLIDLKATKIEKCLADGLIHDYTIEVHGLKNTARMIGAMELSELFYRMEQCGNAEDVATLQQDTPKLLSLYRSYKPILEPYGRAAEGEKESVSVDTIRDTLDEIKQAFDSFDLDGADEAMKKLEEYRLPDELAQDMELLRAYVADVAIQEAMDLCDSMMGKMI